MQVSRPVEYLAVRDFEDLKHYKNRESLPWVKVEQVLLDDPAFISVDATQRGLYFMLCLLAARLKNCVLFDPVYLGRAMRLDGPVDVAPLIQAGLVHVIRPPAASEPMAPCYQNGSERVPPASIRTNGRTNEKNGRTDMAPPVPEVKNGAGDAMTPIGTVMSQHSVFTNRFQADDQQPAS